jgi:hypothetical protein
VTAMVEIKFNNKIDIKIQAQIFNERTLISTGVVEPGESCILTAESGLYDIYFKHGMTGLGLARKLGSERKSVTLSKRRGRYIVT